MSVSASFVAFVVEQLEPIGPITTRRMFGGVGLYAGDVFFALVSRDVLYLKADASCRAGRVSAGARSFRPFPDRPARPTTQYYSVPAAILEDPDELIGWATRSVAIAQAQQASPPTRRGR